jgi:hypothetical protein
MERTHSCALLEATLRDQLGVISRRQVLESGLDDNFIECRLRRKDWARVHRGVYVTHTGPLTWLQRAWAAVLVYWPAALAGRSALVAFGVSPAGGRGGAIAQGSGSALRQLSSSTGPEAPIEVAVDQTRRVGQVDGVDVHRVVNLAAALHPSRRPPVLRLERALLDVASAARDEATAVAVLADACQAGRTTARRLLDVLRPRIRLPGRALLLEVLEDVVAGAYSVLEHRYLTGWSGHTDCPPRSASAECDEDGRPPSATWSISASARSSSSTGGSATSSPSTGGTTWSATSRPPPAATSRSGSATDTCSTLAGAPGSWAGCSARVAGVARCDGAVRPARPPTARCRATQEAYRLLTPGMLLRRRPDRSRTGISPRAC